MNETEAQKLRTDFQGLEKRLDVFEKRINERFEQSEKQRDKRFDQIETRLDSINESLKKLAKDVQSNGKDLKKLDEDIRGNGKNGLNTRLHHVEKMQTIFLGVFLAVLVAFVAHYLGLIEQLKNLAFAG